MRKFWKFDKQHIVTALFLLLLFVNMAGLLVPLAARRLGLTAAAGAEDESGQAQEDAAEDESAQEQEDAGEDGSAQEQEDAGGDGNAQEADGAEVEPDGTVHTHVEPVNLEEAYPFPEEEEEEEPGFYERLTALNGQLLSYVSAVETYCNENVPGRTAAIEAYIGVQKLLGSRIIDGDDVVIKMDNGLLTFTRDELSEEDLRICTENLADFCRFAQEEGADFLYVQTPSKVNKYDNQLPEGYQDFMNPNADRLMAGLEEARVPTLDLRDEIVEDLDFDSAFYASDHHWKPSTGLWAAGEILARLNADYGAGFDLEWVDPARYHTEVIEDIFLGALGKKTGLGYVPLDDMELVLPDYETEFSMEITATGDVYSGDFAQAFLDESQLERGDYYTKNPYAAYFRDDQALVEVENALVDNGKRVLLLKDSFGLSTAPYMATAAEHLSVIDLRHFRGSLQEYVKETQPDMVVVMYNPQAIAAPEGYHADLFDFR